jgi:hypothetical protein
VRFIEEGTSRLRGGRLLTLLLSWLIAAHVLLGDEPIPSTGLHAEDVILRHREALGGVEAFSRLSSLEMEGELQQDGQKVATVVVVRQRPASFLTIVTRPDGHQMFQGYDGKEAWAQLVLGQTVRFIPLDPRAQTNLRRDAPIESPLAFPFLFGLQWSFCDGSRSWTATPSAPAPCLLARYEDGTIVSSMLDPATFLLHKMETVTLDQSGNPTATEAWFEDYRAVDGIQIPFLTRQIDLSGNETVFRLLKASTNAEYPENYFTPRHGEGATEGLTLKGESSL